MLQLEEAPSSVSRSAIPSVPSCPTCPDFSLLLLDPSFVLRQTVASVARDLEVANIHQAMSFETAAHLLASQRFNGCVLAIGEDKREIELIRRLRQGDSESRPTIPVAVMTAECDAEMALTLRNLQVTRILLKPFKVKTILETIVQLAERMPLPR
jgi:DNA-binding NarL/FixJ family response regulator